MRTYTYQNVVHIYMYMYVYVYIYINSIFFIDRHYVHIYAYNMNNIYLLSHDPPREKVGHMIHHKCM